mgnify:CR=1 FL=1
MILSRWVIHLVCGLGSLSVYAGAPFVDPSDDLENLGKAEDVLFWTPAQQVSGYRNWGKVFPTRNIAAGGKPFPLPLNLQDLNATEFTYQDETMSLDEYYSKHSVAGLLIIKDGQIAYERYGLGNDENTVWDSFSVAKSLTSLLLGVALKEGYIKSLDEKVSDYLPRLKGSAYDDASIRHILHMSSGVQWDENYSDPNADINKMPWDARGLYDYLKQKPRVHPAGDQFNYNSAETNLVGTLVRSAIGNNLSTYLSDKIWKPFGMQADGSWELGVPGGGETGGSSFNATLRDFGRIGLFALRRGTLLDGTQVLPEGWMQESTRPAETNKHYGYLWWLKANGAYAAQGIFGQGIYIFPEQNMVVALHSARPIAADLKDLMRQDALIRALVKAGALDS